MKGSSSEQTQNFVSQSKIAFVYGSAGAKKSRRAK